MTANGILLDVNVSPKINKWKKIQRHLILIRLHFLLFFLNIPVNKNGLFTEYAHDDFDMFISLEQCSYYLIHYEEHSSQLTINQAPWLVEDTLQYYNSSNATKYIFLDACCVANNEPFQGKIYPLKWTAKKIYLVALVEKINKWKKIQRHLKKEFIL